MTQPHYMWMNKFLRRKFKKINLTKEKMFAIKTLMILKTTTFSFTSDKFDTNDLEFNEMNA